MRNNDVGIVDLGKVLARGAGLLTGLLGGARASRLGRRLGVTIRRRRLGGVLRVHLEPRPKLRIVRAQSEVRGSQFVQLGSELCQLSTLILVLRRQLDVGRLRCGYTG